MIHLKKTHNMNIFDECEVGLTLFYRGKNNVIKRYLLSAGVFKTGLYSITPYSSTVVSGLVRLVMGWL